MTSASAGTTSPPRIGEDGTRKFQRATDTNLAQQVAIKILPKQFPENLTA